MSKLKECLKCNTFKPLTEFHKHCKTQDGHRTYCKVCRSIYANFYREKNKEEHLKREAIKRIRRAESIKVESKKYANKSTTKLLRFAYTLENTYNITIKDYDRMYEEQNERCKICKISQDQIIRRLCVDHCHSTGKVRGLLCDSCNRLLGQAKDSSDILIEASKYIIESQKEIK